jgi:preprotein translocase subunit SecG
MEQIILIAHLLIALAIIGLIMLQQGKGAEMGASFGAGASQTLFGADGGGNVLTKSTAVLAIAFFATSFGLAFLAKNNAKPVDELDLLVPSIERSLEQELPIIEEDIPAGISAEESDIPDLPVE